MNKSKLLLAILAIATLALVPAVHAEDAAVVNTPVVGSASSNTKQEHRQGRIERLERRSQHLKERAEKLLKEGKTERAEKLQKKAERLEKRAQHLEKRSEKAEHKN